LHISIIYTHMADEKVKQTKIDELIPDDKNFNKGTEYGNSLIEKSLRKFGAGRSVLIDKNNRIIAGNKTIENASAIGLDDVIVVETDGKKIVAVKRTDIDLDSKEGRELALADNQTSAVNFSVDEDVLKDVSDELQIDLDEWGVTFEDDEEQTTDVGIPQNDAEEGSLEKYFIVPPFSVLDTRNGRWQERKKQWNELLNNNGQTREGAIGFGDALLYPKLYKDFKNIENKEKFESFKDYVDSIPEEQRGYSRLSLCVSMFDPVLAEICALWFTPAKGCRIFDPFAGDTQKGLVFGLCGYSFTGIELRREQVDENNRVINGRDVDVRYICDDGQNVRNHIEDESQDLLFSCPPYFDLEVYSDDPKDASNQPDYDSFIKIIDKAFTESVACLKNNRFAVVVVGDVRNEDSGEYYDFPSDIKRIFKRAGLYFMNELILVESVGSSAIKASLLMKGRKVAKTHQNILVFYKGNPRAINMCYFPLDITEQEKEELRETIKSLETEDIAKLSGEDYFKAIAERAIEQIGSIENNVLIKDIKNAIKWEKGMQSTQTFKPIVDYFITAFKESGLTQKQVEEHLGNRMGGHYFSDKSQWSLPTRENYNKLQQIMPNLTRNYDDLVEELRTLKNLSRNANAENLSRIANADGRVPIK